MGVPVLAQASLAALASCDLLLQGISLVPHAGPGSQQPGVAFIQLPLSPACRQPVLQLGCWVCATMKQLYCSLSAYLHRRCTVHLLT